MKISNLIFCFILAASVLCSCSKKAEQPSIESVPLGGNTSNTEEISGNNPAIPLSGYIEIVLSDENIMVNGTTADTNIQNAVYISNDIVYYEEGRDLTYGEGDQNDAHSKEQAQSHTVVNITKPGNYSVSGTLSKGQIAIDLGENAEKDPDSCVNLILNGANITCEVAPAVIFYNVYECGEKDEEKATKDVDTSAAGANVYIADGTQNNVNGSYVARIYKPDSVVLSEDGKTVEDSKKLHKYDAAFYSKMSMNIYGGEENTGVLNINAENEGLDSELHLTINGGNINILSGNDGINTNEDNISVTTINGGTLNIKVTGETGEGDGIDSNGWLVINGGTVITQACSHSMDSGIDSDKGIHLIGGTVISAGHMLDRIEDGGSTYAVFNFAKEMQGGNKIVLKNSSGAEIHSFCPENNYSVVIVSSDKLSDGEYTLWCGEEQLSGYKSEGMGGFGMPGGNRGGRPGQFEGEKPDFEKKAPSDKKTGPEGMTPPNGDFRREDMPEGFGGKPPFDERTDFPEGEMPPQREGVRPGANWQDANIALSDIFVITKGANSFGGITVANN